MAVERIDAGHGGQLRQPAAQGVHGRWTDGVQGGGVQREVAPDIRSDNLAAPGVDVVPGAGGELQAQQVGQAATWPIGEGAPPEQLARRCLTLGKGKVHVPGVVRHLTVTELRRGHRGIAVQEVHGCAPGMLHAWAIAQQGPTKVFGQLPFDETQGNRARLSGVTEDQGVV